MRPREWCRYCKNRPESGLDPAIIETFRLRVRTWWILFSVLVAAFYIGQTATVVLFGLISFWALREFITLTPTRLGDHRTLFFVFFIFTPLQYVLVGTALYGLYSVVIPVYGFLFIPVAIALAGDYKAVFGTHGENSMRAADLRVLFKLRAGAVDAKTAAAGQRQSGRRRQRAAVVLLCAHGATERRAAIHLGQISGKHLIAPSINPSRTWEGLLGGTASVTLIGAMLWWATPYHGAVGGWRA